MKMTFRLIVTIIAIGAYICPTFSLSDSPKFFHQGGNDDLELIQESHFKDKQFGNLLSKDEIYFLDTLDAFSRLNLRPLMSDVGAINVSDKCAGDLKYIFKNLASQAVWAARMIDSYGKPEAGILQGNVNWLGDFDGCIRILVPPDPENNSTEGFRGQYCKLSLTIKIPNQSIPLGLGTCQPDSCSSSDLENYLKQQLDVKKTQLPLSLIPFDLKSIFTGIQFSCQPNSRPLTGAAIVVIFLISIFVLLAVIGSSITVYERFNKERTSKNTTTAIDLKASSVNNSDEQTPEEKEAPAVESDSKVKELPNWIKKSKPFFNCFCFFTNGAKLFNMSSSEGQLPCLHGIRFLSLSWVIAVHTYAFSTGSIRIGGHALALIDAFLFQIILNGFYAVDSFFLLSGFLLAYLYFQQAAKTDGKIPWLYFYVHRYLRLTPVYMMAIAFYTTLMSYTGSGPTWFSFTTESVCSKYWWQNLLYINNFQPSEKQCMGWSWYLSNDMQFFAISPLLLVTLWRWPKIGYSIMGLFFCVSFVSNFAITYHYNLISGLSNLPQAKNILTFMARYTEFMNKIYVKPYTRISAYLVGICLAYYLYKRKQKNSGKDNWMILTGGWVVSTTITLLCLLGLYHRDMSLLEYSFYNAFHRTCFACGLAWVIYVCLTDQGGFVNSILSCKLFIPLSRLTYCAYLVHPMIMFAYFRSVRSLIDFTQITMVIMFLGFLFISYFAAFVTSLIFESPIIRLEKFVRSRFNKS